ncbi:MAG: PAS domain-containing protein [Pseudomonadota bacterium]
MDHDPTKSPSLVSLNERRLARRHPALVQVEGYWDSLRADRLVPDRSDVDPRGLAGALEHAFVLERIAPGLARFRVAGMHLSDLMGLEVRGMPISAIFSPDSRPKLATALEATFQEPAQVRMQLRGEEGVGRTALGGELLILPLRSDGGDVTRALGCVVMDGKIGRQPRRLQITQMEHKTLVGYANAPEAQDNDRAFAESEAAYTRKTPLTKTPGDDDTSGRPSYLRLVHSKD